MNPDPLTEALRFIRPYLIETPVAMEDGSWSPGPILNDLARLVGFGMNWLTREGSKKELRKYRESLLKTKKIRDGSPSLRRRFPASSDFPSGPGSFPVKQTADVIDDMICQCNEILGTKEPIRYPRRKTVSDTLSVWKKYTGKSPQKCAIQPNEHSGDTEAPPYKLCRLILTAIEGKDPKDFRRIYEAAATTYYKK